MVLFKLVLSWSPPWESSPVGRPGRGPQECQYETSRKNSEELHTSIPRRVYGNLQAGREGTAEGREGADSQRHEGLVE